LVPDTHPVLNNFKYQEKVKNDDGSKSEYTRYNFKKNQFYLVEGVDNLLLEARGPNASQYNVPDSHAKVVGSSDKITITPVDNEGNPEKENPVENKPTDNFSKSTKEIKEFLLQ